MKVVGAGPNGNRAGEWVRTQLADPRWTSFSAALAWVRSSGLQQIRPELDHFAQRASVQISVGVDLRGTSEEGLRELLEATLGTGAKLFVFHNESPNVTFHPKVYVFTDGSGAEVMVGSSNMTAGGLETNYEANFVFGLDLGVPSEKDVFDGIHTILGSWTDTTAGLGRTLDSSFVDDLVREGYVLPEVVTREIGSAKKTADGAKKLFPSSPVQPTRPIVKPAKQPSAVSTGIKPVQALRTFVMTLQNTDVGVGQTTPGTARRSPEIFIPLGARDFQPTFWGWPGSYVPVVGKPHILNRSQVRLRIGTQVVEATLMVNENKKDLRIRSEVLRSAGSVGDILKVEVPIASAAYDYYVEVVPASSTFHSGLLALAPHAVPGISAKRWGYF